MSDPWIYEDLRYTITYTDSYVIWDYPDGSREVRPPSGGKLLRPAEDDTWEETDRFEWQALTPFPEWPYIQSYTQQILDDGVGVEGYEEIAGTETVLIKWAGAPDGIWYHFWLDASGAVMRAVLDVGIENPDDAGHSWFIWDVLTLDPSDVGPLPAAP